MTVQYKAIVDRVFFCFQAEDGIRDVAVTGVQTCALPIFTTSGGPETGRSRSSARVTPNRHRIALVGRPVVHVSRMNRRPRRSEERRVGKEGRSGCRPYHYNRTDKLRPGQVIYESMDTINL